MVLKAIQWLVTSKFMMVFILVVIYVACWVLDGIKGYHFDMPEFRQFIGWVAMYVAALHGIDSGLNTPFGKSKEQVQANTQQTTTIVNIKAKEGVDEK
nr:hypothetical protein [uncultured Anaeromusa sp.]